MTLVVDGLTPCEFDRPNQQNGAHKKVRIRPDVSIPSVKGPAARERDLFCQISLNKDNLILIFYQPHQPAIRIYERRDPGISSAHNRDMIFHCPKNTDRQKVIRGSGFPKPGFIGDISDKLCAGLDEGTNQIRKESFPTDHNTESD